MLENVPKVIGQALSGARAGMDKVASRRDAFADVPDTITLTSPAFADGAALPVRCTADGDGVSPPLSWSGVPHDAFSVAIVIEDPDAPALDPLVHALVLDLPAQDGMIPEGGLKSGNVPGQPYGLGKNSFLKDEYLPPDPPTGHGPHHYVFQIFALDRRLDLGESPGRRAVLDAMEGHVLAKGVLIGTYERA